MPVLNYDIAYKGATKYVDPDSFVSAIPDLRICECLGLWERRMMAQSPQGTCCLDPTSEREGRISTCSQLKLPL